MTYLWSFHGSAHRTDNRVPMRRNKATIDGRKQLSETDFVGSKQSPTEPKRHTDNT